jgi:type II secretory pathway component GspD/PulD (secretin)
MNSFAQSQTNEFEIVKLHHIKLTYDSSCIGFAPSEVDTINLFNIEEKTSRFLSIFTKLLSKNGSIEIDFRNQTLIISDNKERKMLVKNLIETLDNSGLTLEELLENIPKKLTN